ncbi:hypothetical protein T01_4424, partial [Trichinella spiralis]
LVVLLLLVRSRISDQLVVRVCFRQVKLKLCEQCPERKYPLVTIGRPRCGIGLCKRPRVWHKCVTKPTASRCIWTYLASLRMRSRSSCLVTNWSSIVRITPVRMILEAFHEKSIEATDYREMWTFTRSNRI